MSKKKSTWNNGEKLIFTDKNNKNMVNDSRLFHHYSLMATNRFKWINLPEGVKSEHIEENLFAHGQVLFFEDEKYGILTLPCCSNGELNVYGEPKVFSVWGINYNNTINIDSKAVRIKANDSCLPQILQVTHYTNLLAQIEDTMNRNLRQQKFPYIIPVTKQNELTMKKFYEKMLYGDDEGIIVDNRLSESMQDGIKVLNTNAPYLLDDLQIHKEKTVNELLTILGINNLSVNKKERLVTGEVDVNNQNIDMNLDLEYKNRKLACAEINKLFNLQIDVIKTIDELKKEGEDNGKIYSGTSPDVKRPKFFNI